MKTTMATTGAKSLSDPHLHGVEDARLDSQANAEIEAGEGISHARVREWLLKLGRGEKAPPPRS